MSEPQALVADTIRFSAVDGPGNRFVLFLQGCNFDCLACHNPDTIGTCDDCGICVEACPSGALRLGRYGTVDFVAERCTGAEECLRVCPRQSSPKTRWRRLADVVDELRPIEPFLSGITVSGGEATLQAPFVRALFHAVKTDPQLQRLTCFVDSNGSAHADTWARLAPVTDGVMVDLKCLDDELHRTMTGHSNAAVLESIVHLQRRGLLHEVRLLIVPGLNDGDELLDRTGRWLATIDPELRVKVIGFRCHGVRPHARLGRDATPEELSGHAERLAAAGLRHLVTV